MIGKPPRARKAGKPAGRAAPAGSVRVPTGMSKTERVYKIESLIRQRGHVSFAELREVLEVSPATLKRDLDYLRDRLGAPIDYDRELNGYRLATGWRGQKHELPGLWFDERELYSLLMAHQLFSELDRDGVIARHLEPLLDRIHGLIGGGGGSEGAEARGLLQRVRIIAPARRPVPAVIFERVAESLLQRRRLHLRYLTRTRAETSERDVSPQRLVHHRSTWYLDAWCHRRERLLRFALDAIEQATLLEARARELPQRQLRAEMDAGYGIFAGGTPTWATLRFTPQAAKWASREQWHAEQKGRWLADGSWQLELPFVDEQELAMDLLRQGPEVRVLSPASLARRVAERHRAAAAQYDDTTA